MVQVLLWISLFWLFRIETIEAVPDVTLVTEYQFVPSASTGQNTSLKCVVGGDFSGVEFSAERNWRLPAARSSVAAIDDESWPGRMVTFFPEGGLDRVGVFSSTVTFPDDQKVKVTTVGISADANIYPKYFTVTANKGDSVTLYTQAVEQTQQTDVRWRRNGFPLFGPTQFTLELTSLDPRFQPGVYECYYLSDYSQKRHAISLLIVRACPEGQWGEECDLPCPVCLNGGQCQVETGECVCSPGFMGPTCRTPCGGNRFGRDCSFHCDESERDDPAGCSGHLFCLPEPYGCSCGPGFTGLLCQRECSPGTFGAGCQSTCHCSSIGPDACDRYTGACRDGCAAGWTGPNCQEAKEKARKAPTPSVRDSDSGLKELRDNKDRRMEEGWSSRTGRPIRRTSYMEAVQTVCLDNMVLENQTKPMFGLELGKREATSFREVCIPNPCRNGGTCSPDPATSGFSCSCERGYAGQQCEEELDECESTPCQNGGVCYDEVGSYVCVCPEEYTGVNCEEDRDFCESDPCRNGGTCVTAPQSFMCLCPEGYMGITCSVEVDECASDPCLNDGNCTDGVASYSCACLPGFNGTDCEINIDECHRDACANGGICEDGINGFTCFCFPGFTGPTCTENPDDCASSPCLNNGTCIDGVHMFFCNCTDGYGGERCEEEIDECASDPCLNGGNCTDGVASYSCACLPGFNGTDCEINVDDCYLDACANGGACEDGIDDFTCVCSPGFTGATCLENINECESSPCLNNGRCIDGVQEYLCDCADGYEGGRCEEETDECLSQPCHNGGTCRDAVATFTCSCPQGFSGDLCQVIEPNISDLDVPSINLENNVPILTAAKEPESRSETKTFLAATVLGADKNVVDKIATLNTNTASNSGDDDAAMSNGTDSNVNTTLESTDQTALEKLKDDKFLDQATYFKLNPNTEQPPAFYGLPKIHKPGVPLRPIVSGIGSVTYNLAGYLAKILGPLVGKSQHHVQNSADFVQKIKDITVAEDEIITSYDVCSLFTCIPPKEAVSVVREALEADDTLADRTKLSVDHICELLDLCLGCTYFTYKQQFFQQVHGCAMGSPVSPIVVNLYMEKFENKALSTFNGPPPANWFRYVDDTWCRLKKRVADDFFDHINQVDDNIKFTQESCQNNMLPFLDTKTIIEKDGNLQFEVYRKPTHTDQYLAFDSHHPLEHKLAVIKTLFHRADNVITSDEAKTEEHRHLRVALAKCGYQNWTFNKALKPSDQSKKTLKCRPLTNRNKVNITIPYVQGVSEKLRRIFQNFNIATNFKPHSTLRQKLVHPKDRPEKGIKANVIYKLKSQHVPEEVPTYPYEHISGNLSSWNDSYLQDWEMLLQTGCNGTILKLEAGPNSSLICLEDAPPDESTSTLPLQVFALVVSLAVLVNFVAMTWWQHS
ncbi:NOTCH2 [Branchiostoma lanceolatum]|uniref:NOTCH2 protein n=1 Tax=Branchiostoma lanceolatum TaxID=7740 RepID=A0A8J9W511_BRALA|nr:NOTCH2 [Branchiostoma lanceolatum]